MRVLATPYSQRTARRCPLYLFRVRAAKAGQARGNRGQGHDETASCAGGIGEREPISSSIGASFNESGCMRSRSALKFA